jgi:4-amino-4-deoxy-L-arabinose transferase-like glycosyltransferase
MVAAVATLPGLGIGTLWDNSETAYGEVAREVLIYGDPIVLHQNGVPWFVQPPLYFWIAAVFARLFGVNEFAMRLPSALATIGMAGAVGYVVARLANPRAALLAAVVLSTSLMQAIVGRLAIMDALLDLAVAVAILSWFAALRTGRARWWYLGWLALALGVLAKGPVALLIAALVIVPWAVWDRRVGRRIAVPSALHWVLGVGLFAAIVGPWAIALYRSAGAPAFNELVGHYTVGRYLGTIENQSGPLWYYLPVLILGTFPWFAFLAPATVEAFRTARDSNEGSLARLALAWAIVPFLFFSFAQTKLPNYIALELPALAILVALWFDAIVRRDDRRAALAWTAVVPVTIVGLAFAVGIFLRDNKLTLDLLALRAAMIGPALSVLVGSAACFVLLLQRRTAWLGAFVLGATSLAALLIIAVVAEPQAERLKPIPPLAAKIRELRRAGDVVAIRGVSGGNALTFYTQPPVAIVDDPGLAALLCHAQRVFVVASRRRPSPDPTYGRRRQTLAVAQNDVLYLFDGPACAVRPR